MRGAYSAWWVVLTKFRRKEAKLASEHGEKTVGGSRPITAFMMRPDSGHSARLCSPWPSCRIPKLWPISCAMTDAVEAMLLIPMLMLHDETEHASFTVRCGRHSGEPWRSPSDTDLALHKMSTS